MGTITSERQPVEDMLAVRIRHASEFLINEALDRDWIIAKATSPFCSKEGENAEGLRPARHF